MKSKFIVWVIVVALVGIVFVAYKNNSGTKMEDVLSVEQKKAMVPGENEMKEGQKKETGEMMMEKNGETMMEGKGEMMQKGETMMEKNDSVMVKPGTFEAYDISKLVNAKTGNVVLFFDASWCPSCQTLKADINKNITNIPGDLTILDVDYDKYTELKKKYGVTYQHTLVQVDSDGNMIKKWNGGNSLGSIVSQIK